MLIQLRTTPTYKLQTSLRIDRSNLVIHDLVAMQADVEALGHGMMSDRKTLDLMVDLGNQSNRPIRGRFGHPGISENATGKQVMVSTNFRITEDPRGAFLVHDANFLPAARLSPAFAQDPLEYIFRMAETTPTEFAESVVAEVYTVWTCPDGSELPVYEKYVDEEGDTAWRKNPRPADALTKLPIIRPVSFWYCDLVNEGALTHAGMFSAGALNDIQDIFTGHSSAYASEIFQIVDRWRDAYHVPLSDLRQKVDQLFHAYISTRKDHLPMSKPTSFEPGPEGAQGETNSQQPLAPAANTRRKGDADMNRAQALLEQAEQLAQTASQQAAFMDQVSGQVVNRTELTQQSESIADLQAEVAELRATVGQLTERLNTLTGRQQEFQDLTIRMQTAAQTAINHMQMQLATFQQNLQRMDGQPVVDHPVRMHGDMNSLCLSNEK